MQEATSRSDERRRVILIHRDPKTIGIGAEREPFRAHDLRRARHVTDAKLHLPVAGNQILDRSFAKKLPFVDDRHAIAHQFHFAEKVAGDEDGHLTIVREVSQ